MGRPVLFLGIFMLAVMPGIAQEEQSDAPAPSGLLVHEPEASPGYTLFSPLDTPNSYLIDNEGRLVHIWEMKHRTGAPYLLDNGNLLRPMTYGNDGNGHFHGGGAGHGIQEVAWDGTVVWEFSYSSEDYLIHHDIEPLPNGNVLIIAWERKSREEAIAAGRDPETMGDEAVWPLHVVEIEPTYPEGGRMVWSWHIWDHLIQDYDETKANYGKVADHPELLDINPPGHWVDRISEEERAQLEALGYLTGKEQEQGSRGEDWLHTNAIAYNAELDQIALSVLGVNEIWIIDHSTTTEEARGHTGGRAGKGGDILYRWGNPYIYRAGAEADQALFAQHDVHWIPEGRPGAGHLLIYNNGRRRPDGDYSSVVEIVPPLQPDGTYAIALPLAYGPTEPVWEYTAPNKEDFYSSYISGARRMPNGNTLICQGADGTIFEVTADKRTVWRYVNPVMGAEGASHRGADRDPTNALFRAYRYGPDHPGFVGKDLSPGPLLEDYTKNHPPAVPITRPE